MEHTHDKKCYAKCMAKVLKPKKINYNTKLWNYVYNFVEDFACIPNNGKGRFDKKYLEVVEEAKAELYWKLKK